MLCNVIKSIKNMLKGIDYRDYLCYDKDKLMLLIATIYKERTDFFMSNSHKILAASLIAASLLAQTVPMSVLAAEESVSPTDLPTAVSPSDTPTFHEALKEKLQRSTVVLPSYNAPNSDLMLSGSTGGIKYELTNSGVLTLKGTGAMLDFGTSTAPWYEKRYFVRSVQIEDGITAIGNYAFNGCSSLSSVSIPDSVTSIGNFAFDGCKFENITIPDSVDTIGNGAFSFCSKMKKIVIPESVTTISNKTFYYCQSLESVALPESLTAINYQAFYSCEKLENIDIPDSITTIGSNAFEASGLTSIAIPNTVTSIEKETFKECKKLTSVQLPQTITSIGNNAFSSCVNLSNIAIPDTVTSIGDGAFNRCGNLTNVTIPSSLTSIGASVFYNSGLIEVTIPTDVTSIAPSAFAACQQLSSINVMEENSAYTSVDGILYNKEATNLITCPAGKSTVDRLPNTVNTIEGGAFIACSKLTSITIPVSVTSIGSGTFDSCNSLADVYYEGNARDWKSIIGLGNDILSRATLHVAEGSVLDTGSCGENVTYTLTTDGTLTFTGTGNMTYYSEDEYTPWYGLRNYIKSVQIENGITSIGGEAFYNCRYLENVSIPDSVTYIGQDAFYFCSGLKEITLPNSLLSIGREAFSDSGLKNLVIPDSVKSIGICAFGACYSLESVVVPVSVTSFTTGVFEGCGKLMTIYYKGTEEEWKKVYIESDNSHIHWIIDNDGVHYNYGKTLSEGKCGDNLNYSLVSDVLTISGSGAMYDFAEDGSDLPWIGDITTIRTIKIENGVTTIGNNAFCGLTNLNDVTIPGTVTSIGQSAFINCNNKKFNSVILESVTNIDNYAFQGCSFLSKVVMDSAITIGDYAFANTNLQMVMSSDMADTEYYDGIFSLPDSVVSIGEGAFRDNGLQTINIPKSTVFIGKNAFYSKLYEKTYNVDPANTVYASKDGVLYDKDYKTLLKFPKAKDSISEIPATVMTIADGAFSWASKLKILSIPVSVTSIQNDAFSNCTLTDVYYGGSEYDWSKIVIDSGNDALTNATIHYTEYDVKPDVNGAASKLYEPWGLRYFAVFDGADSDKIADRGIAILKESYYTDGMTPEAFCADDNAFVFRESAGKVAFDSNFNAYYATLEKGIYSYDIAAKYYVVPFAELNNSETVYGSIKSNSMENILNTNLGRDDVSDTEKVVARCILALKESVAAHYAAEGIPGASADLTIPRGNSQSAAAAIKTAEHSGVTPNIYAGASRLIEPWGLRYFASCSGSTDSIKERGVVILKETDYQESYSTSPDSMRLNANAYIFRSNDGTLVSDDGANYYATVSQGISSENISDVYYVVPFVVLNDDSYVYGTVKSNSMLNIMNANLQDTSIPSTEKAVTEDIVDLYNAVKAHYAS